uniref:Uncharacterized protein n=1 Tax=Arundo donax TaxID=35708 RepID=A0A0A9D5E3_ARUDO
MGLKEGPGEIASGHAITSALKASSAARCASTLTLAFLLTASCHLPRRK